MASRRRAKGSHKARDYKAEYQRRIARGMSKGLSRSQSRGHARAGERPKPSAPSLIDPTRPEERAIRLMKEGASFRAAAAGEGIREEKLRRYLKENTQATRVGRRWTIVDERPRQFPFYSKGRLISPILGPIETSQAARYMHAVKEFLPTGDPSYLKPFVGHGVRGIDGKRHPFETDENTLYELDLSGELSFPEFYQILT